LTTSAHALGAARSFLFVPGNRPERFIKALASGAEAVIIDLEDAVAPADKNSAREQLRLAFSQIDLVMRSRLIVRINASGTAWEDADLLLVQDLARQGLTGVLPAKAESVAALARVASAVGPSCALLPLIESIAGLDQVNQLAAAPQVLRLVFGHLDFQADVGLACDSAQAELVPVRLELVLATRRAGIASAVDGVTLAISDSVQLQNDSARSRRAGFGAKLCIHPAQVDIVNAAFAPSEAEIDWALRVLATTEATQGGVTTLDGRMVDAPVVLLAHRTLARVRNSR